MPNIQVDNQTLTVPPGTNLLQACLDNHIYIPNLCHLPDRPEPHASCRLCMVAIEGRPQPVTACTEIITTDLVVHTDTPEVRRLQRSALRLLLSVHHIDCKHCPANKACGLQQLARFLKVGLNAKPLPTHLKAMEVDTGHPFIDHYPNRCVLCGRCVYICQQHHPSAGLTFARRGMETVISAFGHDTAGSATCRDCRVCVDICPVAALQPRHALETDEAAVSE